MSPTWEEVNEARNAGLEAYHKKRAEDPWMKRVLVIANEVWKDVPEEDRTWERREQIICATQRQATKEGL